MVGSCDHYVAFLRRGRQGIRFLFYGLDQVLNGIHFTFLEICLATLLAYPSWNAVEQHVAAFAVNVKRSCVLLHLSLAVNTFHTHIVSLKSSVHLSGSEMYAVTIAR